MEFIILFKKEGDEMRKVGAFIFLTVVLTLFFSLNVYADLNVSIFHQSNTNTKLEEKLIENIIKQIKERESLIYTEKKNTSRMILIISSIAREDEAVFYGIDYVMTFPGDKGLYYLDSFTGFDPEEKFEEASKMIMDHLIATFNSWLEYLNN